jgi:hypothetical protein
MPAGDWMQDQRDPVSRWFDAAAARLLQRAYDDPGHWVAQYLAPPSQAARAELATIGIDPFERDRWGEVRWVRAFKRSVYWNLRTYGYATAFRPGAPRTSPKGGRALEWQTGRRVTKPGWPAARWAIRVRLHPAGAAAHRAALSIPAGRRWINPATGEPTARQSTTLDRDWLGY